MRLELLECRRVLTGQLDIGMALEQVYQSNPAVFPDPIWNDATSVVQGDLDLDGQLDLMVLYQREDSNQVTEVSVLFAGQGDGTYAPRELPSPLPTGRWTLGDIEGDGDLDLLSIPNRYSTPNRDIRVSLNRGVDQGSWQGFQPSVSQSVLPAEAITAFATADFDRDGFLDLALSTANGLAVKPGLGDGQFGEGIQYPLSNGSQALVAGDLDADGDMDLVSAKGTGEGETGPQSLDLLINDGEGIFEPQESQAKFESNINHLALGDLDDDGDLDVAATHMYSYGDNVSLGMGNGAGDFVDDPQQLDVNAHTYSVSLGDINDDGNVDLCVNHGDTHHGQVTPGMTVFLGKGNGFFQTGVDFDWGRPLGTFVAQLDGLGPPEISIVTGWGATMVRVMRVSQSEYLPPAAWQLQDGAATEVVFTATDWDGNGLPDALVSTPAGAFLRISAGTDQEYDIATKLRLGWHQAQLQDVTGDRRPDVLAIYRDGVRVLPQRDDGLPGEPIFTSMRNATLISGGVVDVNRDGIRDLLLAETNTLSIWLGQGDGTFQEKVDAENLRGREFHAADWDQDGFVDLLSLAGTRLSILRGDVGGFFQEIFHQPIPADATLQRILDVDGDGDPDAILELPTESRWLPWGTNSQFIALVNAGNGSMDALPESTHYEFVATEYERILTLRTEQNGFLAYRATHENPTLSEVIRKSGSNDSSPNLESLDDLDQDGDLDVVLSSSTGKSILFGLGDGTFTEFHVDGEYRIIDWDGDGDSDVLLSAGSAFRVLLRHQNGGYEEGLREPISTGYFIAELYDFDADGDQDVVLRNGDACRILLNQEGSSFEELARCNSYRTADLDGDGLEELLVQWSRSLIVYRLSETGSFAEVYRRLLCTMPITGSRQSRTSIKMVISTCPCYGFKATGRKSCWALATERSSWWPICMTIVSSTGISTAISILFIRPMIPPCENGTWPFLSATAKVLTQNGLRRTLRPHSRLL